MNWSGFLKKKEHRINFNCRLFWEGTFCFRSKRTTQHTKYYIHRNFKLLLMNYSKAYWLVFIIFLALLLWDEATTVSCELWKCERLEKYLIHILKYFIEQSLTFNLQHYSLDRRKSLWECEYWGRMWERRKLKSKYWRST